MAWLYSNGLMPWLYCDGPEPWLIGFQDSGSPGHEGITELHDTIMFYLIVVAVGVGWVLGGVCVSFNEDVSPLSHKYYNHGTLVEVVWTVSPALVLVAVAFPSFKLLYVLDEVVSPSLTIKVVGHQWYWSYELSDFLNGEGDPLEYDSYMVPEGDLMGGQLRQLDVDNRVVLPVDTHVRFVVTANDVLHDFAVPSLGLKIDACPGRLNQTSVVALREGVYYGQCSELCGVHHGFMPIVIEAVDLDAYLVWLDSQA